MSDRAVRRDGARQVAVGLAPVAPADGHLGLGHALRRLVAESAGVAEIVVRVFRPAKVAQAEALVIERPAVIGNADERLVEMGEGVLKPARLEGQEPELGVRPGEQRVDPEAFLEELFLRRQVVPPVLGQGVLLGEDALGGKVLGGRGLVLLPG